MAFGRARQHLRRQRAGRARQLSPPYALLEGGMVENAATVGKHMEARLQTWLDRYPFVGDVRGKGLCSG